MYGEEKKAENEIKNKQKISNSHRNNISLFVSFFFLWKLFYSVTVDMGRLLGKHICTSNQHYTTIHCGKIVEKAYGMRTNIK